MSKFRKGRLASAMLCTLLLGGNAGAIKKDMSKTISKNDLSTKDKELENRKSDDSGNKLLEYFLYCLGGLAGVAKLADEGVGIAEAKDYIDYYKSQKLSPLGKLSLYKFAMAKYYKTKTIGTMRNLVAESNKNKCKIHNFFNKVTEKVYEIKYNKHGCFRVKENLFDISLAVAGDNYLNIKYICRDAGLTEDKNPAIPEYVEEYVKAVLGVSVEQCDRILVNVCDDKLYRHIAFVKGNVCLRLRPFGLSDKLEFCLTCLNKELGFVGDDYALDLYDNSYCYSVALPYMERILGVKRDKNYIGILNGEVGRYSFYGQIFHDLYDYWKGMNDHYDGSVRQIFPDLFAEKE